MTERGWYAATAVRVVSKWLAVASVVWFVAGLLVVFGVAMSWDQRSFDLAHGWSVGGVVVIGLVVGVPGFLLSIFVLGICQHLMDEHLWRSGLRRGIATVHDLRPGYTSSNSATQNLTCRLEIRIVGMDTISADYGADIGPLDAPRFVEGATFACQVSPQLPRRVRLWVFADPDAGDLTGRYRDFRPPSRIDLLNNSLVG